MLVKNYDLNFTFQMEDDFTEISKDKYSVFGVDEDSTLNYFVYIDEDDGSESGFSLIKGANTGTPIEASTISTEKPKSLGILTAIPPKTLISLVLYLK